MKRIALFIICFHTLILSAQQINEPYEFPVKPGTEEWSKLKTEKERFDAMQIPENILPSMSTEALAISCVNFPAFGYFGANDNYQAGFNVLATKFNGMKELLKRTDAGSCILNIYKNAGENGIENSQFEINGKYWPLRLSWIELLLSQEAITKSLKDIEKNKLLSISLLKFKMKQLNKEHSPDGLLTTSLLMGRLLYSMDYHLFVLEYNQNESLNNFLNSSKLTDFKTIDLIVKYVNNYLNTK